MRDWFFHAMASDRSSRAEIWTGSRNYPICIFVGSEMRSIIPQMQTNTKHTRLYSKIFKYVHIFYFYTDSIWFNMFSHISDTSQYTVNWSLLRIIWFEGVSSTTVIPALGACRTGALSSTWCVGNIAKRCQTWLCPSREFRGARCCRQAQYFSDFWL